MKLSTIAATILLFSEGAYASHQETATRRMRSVKIYSSTPQRNADLSKDIVDPYIGLPDERGQRGLKHNKPTAESVPEPALEMSMPSGGSLPDHQSLSLAQPSSEPSLSPSAMPSKCAKLLSEPSLTPSTSDMPSSEPSLLPSCSTYHTSQPSLMPSKSAQPSFQQDSTGTAENDVLIRRRGLGKGKGKRPKPTNAPTLEMSMPAGASMSMSMPDNQSFSYSLQLQDSTGESAGAGLPHRRVAEEGEYNGSRITGHSSVVVAGAAIASLIAAVIAL